MRGLLRAEGLVAVVAGFDGFHVAVGVGLRRAGRLRGTGGLGRLGGLGRFQRLRTLDGVTLGGVVDQRDRLGIFHDLNERLAGHQLQLVAFFVEEHHALRERLHVVAVGLLAVSYTHLTLPTT